MGKKFRDIYFTDTLKSPFLPSKSKPLCRGPPPSGVVATTRNRRKGRKARVRGTQESKQGCSFQMQGRYWLKEGRTISEGWYWLEESHKPKVKSNHTPPPLRKSALLTAF